MQEITEEELFQNITVIFQDFMRYNFTVRQNIAIGQLEVAADQERLEEVAVQTGVEQFVRGFHLATTPSSAAVIRRVRISLADNGKRSRWHARCFPIVAAHPR